MENTPPISIKNVMFKSRPGINYSYYTYKKKKGELVRGSKSKKKKERAR